jgi:hypothetical protein
VLMSGVGCHAQAPASAVAPKSNTSAVALCPPTMPGEDDRQFPLTGLTIMRDENGEGWRTFPPSDPSRMSWTMPQAANTRYRAACEYGDEIIGVAIDARFRRCWLERGTQSVKAWCDGAG